MFFCYNRGKSLPPHPTNSQHIFLAHPSSNDSVIPSPRWFLFYKQASQMEGTIPACPWKPRLSKTLCVPGELDLQPFVYLIALIRIVNKTSLISPKAKPLHSGIAPKLAPKFGELSSWVKKPGHTVATWLLGEFYLHIKSRDLGLTAADSFPFISRDKSLFLPPCLWRVHYLCGKSPHWFLHTTQG